MKLSISNIGWSSIFDNDMYNFLEKSGFQGLEIAPTRIVNENPYDNLSLASEFSRHLTDEFGISISSMQSIWFGRNEKIFESEREYDLLFNYTKKAIDFAESLNCPNLVFGCPVNRSIKSINDVEKAMVFFTELAKYAEIKNTVIAIEPNPKIYKTNFLNTTIEAYDFVKEINSKGIGINLDLGTIIENKEDISIVEDVINFVNHVHISEPYLVRIKKRSIHIELLKELKRLNYNKYVSIEMKNLNDIDIVKGCIMYVKELFDDI